MQLTMSFFKDHFNIPSWLDQKGTRLTLEKKSEQGRLKAIKEELEWVRSTPRDVRRKTKLASVNRLVSKCCMKTSISISPEVESSVLSSLMVRVNHVVSHDYRRRNTKKGEFIVSESVQIGYVDQSLDSLADNRSVWEEISDGQEIITVGGYQISSRAYCRRFTFKSDSQQKCVGDLSGGERNRVHLAKLLKSGGNLMLLDEPTNDRDAETLCALEEALLNFPGCAVVISHDH